MPRSLMNVALDRDLIARTVDLKRIQRITGSRKTDRELLAAVLMIHKLPTPTQAQAQYAHSDLLKARRDAPYQNTAHLVASAAAYGKANKRSPSYNK